MPENFERPRAANDNKSPEEQHYEKAEHRKAFGDTYTRLLDAVETGIVTAWRKKGTLSEEEMASVHGMEKAYKVAAESLHMYESDMLNDQTYEATVESFGVFGAALHELEPTLPDSFAGAFDELPMIGNPYN